MTTSELETPNDSGQNAALDVEQLTAKVSIFSRSLLDKDHVTKT